jgi:hypothetical protein
MAELIRVKDLRTSFPSTPICCRLFRAIEHGDPKEARIFAAGGHMGRVPGQRNDEALAVATQWLKRKLTQS